MNVNLPFVDTAFVSEEAVQEATVSSLIEVAKVAAETYDRIENPDVYGTEGSAAALLEWFPKLRAALNEAGLLRL